MTVHTFQAPSAAEAVAQIRHQLGPEAVVLNVRRAPATGLSRLWRRPTIEVQATVPVSSAPEATPTLPTQSQATDPVLTMLQDLRAEMAGIKRQLAGGLTESSAPPAHAPSDPDRETAFEHMAVEFGLLPEFARTAKQAWQASGTEPQPEGDLQVVWLKTWLTGQWRLGPDSESADTGTHIFIGPAGSGKSTVLCKWLAQETLLQNRRACVWRLDSGQANTAGWVEIYAEILGVPLERSAQGGTPEAALLFIDLPGTDWTNPVAVNELADHLRQLPGAQLHLVLNGAYAPATLLAQAAAFSALPVTDLVVTHIDETRQRGALWNLILGTKLPVRFLSAGQNVPGMFVPATPASFEE